MLTELLRQLTKDALQKPADLADYLGVTPTLVAQMTEQLVRQGYLAEVTTCHAGCTHCPLQTSCTLERGKPKLWQLTEKGKRALQSRAAPAS